MNSPDIRHDWTIAEIEAIYTAPLPDLVFRAQVAHRAFHRTDEVQGCMLLSIKTGGCPEDCAYCPQSAHYKTDVGRQDLVSLDELTEAATRAKEQGAVRFCMGAAWRDVPNNDKFDRVLDMVRVVRGLGMEACCTLGMLTQEQADRLAGAGLTAYNHNLDTSPEFYGNIITTRTYDERLDTLARVRAGGHHALLRRHHRPRRGPHGALRPAAAALHARTRIPESVPVNMLVGGRRHAAGAHGARGSARAGSHDRDRAHPDAEGVRPPQRRPPAAHRRGAGALLHCRRQLRVPRRSAADDAESRASRTTSSCSTSWGCG